MSEQTPSTPADPPPPNRDVSAKAGRYYRNTRYILVIALVLYGLWNIHDGFYEWPRINAAERARGSDKLPYSDMDLLFNRVLGCVLPPGALLLLGWAMYSSRDEYRLMGDELTIPGHPTMRLSQIESVDKQKWDRKGVAWITYRADNGKIGTFKLDDFVYERDGIDEIFRRIELSLLEPRQPKIAPAPRLVTPPPPRPLPRPRI